MNPPNMNGDSHTRGPPSRQMADHRHRLINITTGRSGAPAPQESTCFNNTQKT
jgi:hypothetical protein